MRIIVIVAHGYDMKWRQQIFIIPYARLLYAPVMTHALPKLLAGISMWAFVVFIPVHISFAQSYMPQQRGYTSGYSQQGSYQLYNCGTYYSYSPCYGYQQPYYPSYPSYTSYSYPQYYYPQYSYPQQYYYPSYGYNTNANYNYNYNSNFNGWGW